MHFVNVEAGGLVGLPVLTDPAPHLVLDYLHTELFKLFPQLLNHIAHDPAVDFHVGPVVEHVEGTGNVDFQRRGKPLGLRLRLLAQKRVEVPQHRHFLRPGVLQVLPVDHMDAAVHHRFLHRLQPGLAAHNQLHEGEDEVAFQRQGVIILRVVEGYVHGVDVLVGGGGNVDHLPAQPPDQGRIFVLRVDDGNIVRGNKESVGDLPLGGEGFAGTRGSED